MNRAGIGRSIGNKLNHFNTLFTKWKNGEKVDARQIEGLTDFDALGTDFDDYKNNPELFNDLDEYFEKDENL